MGVLDNALDQVGVQLDGAVGAVQDVIADVEGTVNDLAAAVSNFNIQNLTPNDIFSAARFLTDTVGGVLDGASQIPSMQGSFGGGPTGGGGGVGVGGTGQGGSPAAGGTGGVWESTHYADDMNAHHPKFKFLFKVKFEGFGSEDFYRYVTRCDKPRVRLNHTDINYYNFHTRVLTSVTYDPISITFLDEIGNSVNQFFVNYLKRRTGTANGNFGIDKGFVNASMKPYDKGYSDAGAKITIEQVFANGTLSNRFVFINPRIESFDFDELSMDDNAGSNLTCTFSYDALEMKTVSNSVLYTWGETDLLRGGGTSGAPNAGAGSLGESGSFSPSSAGGGGIGGGGSYETKQPGAAYDALRAGTKIKSKIPGSISDLINPAIGLFEAAFNQTDIVSSVGDLVQRDIQSTLDAIRGGTNLVFGGNEGPTTIEDAESQSGAPPFVGTGDGVNGV